MADVNTIIKAYASALAVAQLQAMGVDRRNFPEISKKTVRYSDKCIVEKRIDRRIAIVNELGGRGLLMIVATTPPPRAAVVRVVCRTN